jgi:hypothetical protein
MTEELKTKLAGIVMLGALFFFLAFCLLAQGCASIKYGSDADYVRGLKNPIFVGTQVNAHKLMSDKGVLQAGMDFVPSAAADVVLMPWYLMLYWKAEETELPYAE